MQKAKVLVVRADEGSGKEVLYENGKFTNALISYRRGHHPRYPLETMLSDTFMLKIVLTIDYRGRQIERSVYLDIGPRSRPRKLIKDEQDPQGSYKTATFSVEPPEYQMPMLAEIMKLESEFSLTEEELLEDANRLIKGEYERVDFLTQKEIAGNIVDGLAFVDETGAGKDYMYPRMKIIAFEAKTDKDTFKRLHDQVDGYIRIADEVYLVLDNKSPPPDLPPYVGVIKNGEITRKAQSLKHEADIEEIWKSFLDHTARQCIRGCGRKDILKFFRAVESLKRKLLWNQFLDGFSGRAPTKKYVGLTPLEKKMVREYVLAEKGGTMLDND